MSKAVLFDLDGTLLDSAPDLVATLNHLRATLGLAALPVEDLSHFVARGAPGLIKAGMPPCDDETLALWRGSFVAHYQDNFYTHTRPFEGVDGMLSELADRDIPWGIVTNKMEALTYPILERTGWLSLASTVVCGDTLENSKPHPEPVLTACKVIGFDPENTLMVGDDLRDMAAGLQAGCRTAFALYGYADHACHSDVSEHTTMIKTPGEVLDLLFNPGPI